MENLEEAKEVLHRRIEEERKGFHGKVLALSPTEIVLNVYKLDCISNICQILHEIINDMSMNELRILLSKEQILEWFYQNWLKENDDYYQQMKESVMRIMSKELSICLETED